MGGIGRVFALKFAGVSDPPYYIFLLPTKFHYNEKSEYWYVTIGAKALDVVANSYGIGTAAVPKLGCGLGNLEWPIVNSLLKQLLTESKVKYIIYGEDT